MNYNKKRSNPVIKNLKLFYRRLFPKWTYYLKKELSECNTVLDLGAGYNSPIQYCNVPFSVGVELFEPYLQESKMKGFHNNYIKADIRKIEFKPKSFDAVIAIEVLEHLEKKKGYRLLEKMEQIARKKVIIETPNEYIWQSDYDNNSLQVHKSGWSAEELKELGFQVCGVKGWKKLRGYKGSIKYKPTFFWERISDLTQKITRYFPKAAFGLFATKQIDEDKRK